MSLEMYVRSTPNQYISQSGALKQLPTILKPFRKPYIITGHKSYAEFKTYCPSELLDIPVLLYDGTSSDENAHILAEQARDADVVIAIGGGKVCDTAKMTAHELACDIITVPTVAATCAPTSAVVANYYPNHTFKDIGYMARLPYACVVDLDLLVMSPIAYYIGGICDTLVKWYEADSIARHIQGDMDVNVALGLAAAKVTQQVLLKDTQDALHSMQTRTVTPAFKRVVDTIFNVAAAVGSFAGEYGRIAGAHAVHNALSLFHETHDIQHGVKVAYGLLVQLVVTGELDEAQRLIQFYHEQGFIYSWKQLHIAEPIEIAAIKMAQFAASEKESFRLAVPTITPDMIVEAVYHLEKLVAETIE